MKVITIDADTGKRVYTRKEVATFCGVSTQILSIWERNKCIPPAQRDENEYRYWNEDELEKIKEYASTPVKERHKQ